MRERPILFSAPMVRAILAGTKTQTRRVLKPQPGPSCCIEEGADGEPPFIYSALHGAGPGYEVHESRTPCPCPYGAPGDMLYVRETWAETDRGDGTPVVTYAAGGCIAVGREHARAKDQLIPEYAWPETPTPGRWRPSIHMPRWASRITLEVTGVRVERLQDISEADAEAEGCANTLHMQGGRFANENFRWLWESINGDDSWDANPWVWVVEFRRVQP